jgi:hypothetical protein
MFEKSDKRRLIWTCCALAGALVLASKAFAGNYAAVVPSNSGIEYFSVELTPGQYLQSDVPHQLLIDDITYGVYITLDYYVPIIPPLWTNPEFSATYETGGIVGSSMLPWLQHWVWGPPGGALPSGRTITFEVESWVNMRYEHYYTRLQEATGSGDFVRAIDESTQTVMAALYGRGEHIPGFGRGDVAATGISEAVATLSESRHFQTPHIITASNRLECVSSTSPPSFYALVYVKGRFVADNADLLTEHAHIYKH